MIRKDSVADTLDYSALQPVGVRVERAQPKSLPLEAADSLQAFHAFLDSIDVYLIATAPTTHKQQSVQNFEENLRSPNPWIRKPGQELKPEIHVFGHTHFGWDAVHDGVRYVQAAGMGLSGVMYFIID